MPGPLFTACFSHELLYDQFFKHKYLVAVQIKFLATYVNLVFSEKNFLVVFCYKNKEALNWNLRNLQNDRVLLSWSHVV